MGDLRSGLNNILGVALRPGSYLNLIYLLLAFPLGIFYFVWLTTGLSLGLGLLYFFVGLPLLLATMSSWRLFGKLEGLQAKWLLGAEVSCDKPVGWAEAGGLWNWLTSRLSSRYTWRSLAFLLLKMPLGLISFIVLTVISAICLSLISMPLLYQHIDITVGSPIPLESWQAWSLMFAGFLLSLLALHLFNGMAAVFRWLSGNLLNTEPRHV